MRGGRLPGWRVRFLNWLGRNLFRNSPAALTARVVSQAPSWWGQANILGWLLVFLAIIALFGQPFLLSILSALDVDISFAEHHFSFEGSRLGGSGALVGLVCLVALVFYCLENEKKRLLAQEERYGPSAAHAQGRVSAGCGVVIAVLLAALVTVGVAVLLVAFSFITS